MEARRPDSSAAPVEPVGFIDSTEAGGFTPGEVLADRYRIVSLLGRGGMGEVYRADDLKLGQTIALKFLPRAVSEDREKLALFHAEVRNARKVSHPNVCRVYDIGEVNGYHYLSMEYVDGETLASLLKRIGRLPPDKALETSLQLCAGLAAVHDKGVLHRDLKPANVMIDGRGRARITDFGIAVAESSEASGEIVGTPPYMAPEQLDGNPATTRSDVYALGLVLYELWTGRPAYEARTLRELRERKRELPASPSESAHDMDPAVEQLILRCLEPDATRRPASGIQMMVALPGGDSVAAANAARTTPSPEMVAALKDRESLSGRTAWATAVVALLLAATAVTLLSRARLLEKAGFRKSPEVMSARSREILGRLGYSEEPADSAFGFSEGENSLRWILVNDSSVTRWERLPSDALAFWYRESPRSMAPERFDLLWLAKAVRVAPDDPPMNQTGMALLYLDSAGHLERLQVVPQQTSEMAGAESPPDWEALFREAGLDPARYRSVPPKWWPLTFADARAAWTGPHPDRPLASARIEAAAYRGRPVSFQIIGPWDDPGSTSPRETTAWELLGLSGWYTLCTRGTPGRVSGRPAQSPAGTRRSQRGLARGGGGRRRLSPLVGNRKLAHRNRARAFHPGRRGRRRALSFGGCGRLLPGARALHPPPMAGDARLLDQACCRSMAGSGRRERHPGWHRPRHLLRLRRRNRDSGAGFAWPALGPPDLRQAFDAGGIFSRSFNPPRRWN